MDAAYVAEGAKTVRRDLGLLAFGGKMSRWCTPRFHRGPQLTVKCETAAAS